MRAIKIDPATRRISEIELIRNPNRILDEICLLIGCSRLELIQLDSGIVLAADADGRQKPMRGTFTFIGNHDLVIHGIGIVLGGEGRRLRALREGKASFDMITEWLTPVDNLKNHTNYTACRCGFDEPRGLHEKATGECPERNQ